MPELELNEISPAIVKKFVDVLHKQTADLLPAYGILDTIQEASMPSGKVPANVLHNLEYMSASLNALGVPTTVPNDVFQIAQTVRNDVAALAES
ncbi:MAG: hypothetical protein ABJL99_16830 [Aliishimia sp.]